ncbi:MAG TPA: type II toxin-antitoxin system prevent-host-death family antitoxin [Roseiarcus sp.]|nr:type II toxin-antitoxin system prevent-host-death family antitoxin [Roseiarcus sp.]
MLTVDLNEAQASLSRLVALVESGEEAEIVITRSGKPVARLLPAPARGKAGRRLGLLEGQFPSTTQEEFDADNTRIAQLFGES